MDESPNDESALAAALKLTAGPPQAWIDAAASIPSTLGDLETIERLIGSMDFRAQFATDPHAALVAAGIPDVEPLLAALHERLG